MWATTCEHCRFFCAMAIAPVPDGGECRLDAPQIIPLRFADEREADSDYTVWMRTRFPIVPPDSWCGKWRPKA